MLANRYVAAPKEPGNVFSPEQRKPGKISKEKTTRNEKNKELLLQYELDLGEVLSLVGVDSNDHIPLFVNRVQVFGEYKSELRTVEKMREKETTTRKRNLPTSAFSSSSSSSSSSTSKSSSSSFSKSKQSSSCSLSSSSSSLSQKRIKETTKRGSSSSSSSSSTSGKQKITTNTFNLDLSTNYGVPPISPYPHSTTTIPYPGPVIGSLPKSVKLPDESEFSFFIRSSNDKSRLRKERLMNRENEREQRSRVKELDQQLPCDNSYDIMQYSSARYDENVKDRKYLQGLEIEEDRIEIEALDSVLLAHPFKTSNRFSNAIELANHMQTSSALNNQQLANTLINRNNHFRAVSFSSLCATLPGEFVEVTGQKNWMCHKCNTRMYQENPQNQAGYFGYRVYPYFTLSGDVDEDNLDIDNKPKEGGWWSGRGSEQRKKWCIPCVKRRVRHVVGNDDNDVKKRLAVIENNLFNQMCGGFCWGF